MTPEEKIEAMKALLKECKVFMSNNMPQDSWGKIMMAEFREQEELISKIDQITEE